MRGRKSKTYFGLVIGLVLSVFGGLQYLGGGDEEAALVTSEIVWESGEEDYADPTGVAETISDSAEEKTSELTDETISEVVDEQTSETATDVSPYEILNNNIPLFSDADKLRTDAFETYSHLDEFGRCGVAYANICLELMPTEERGEIGQIKPSGWHTVKYPELISGNYLYNRCHLIGYQLAGENANEKNLITGTRFLNVEGMLPFENEVAEYVEETGHHVLYRVTPLFTDDNLVADGVTMEAWSVEDAGAGICFYVYCPNVQPGITIDYATGESWETK